jgi:hypothetical protein
MYASTLAAPNKTETAMIFNTLTSFFRTISPPFTYLQLRKQARVIKSVCLRVFSHAFHS